MDITKRFNTHSWLAIFLCSLLFIACKEAMVNEPEPLVAPPSLQQEIFLEIDGAACIDHASTTTCYDNPFGRMGSVGYSSNASSYLYRANYSFRDTASCTYNALNLRLMWSGPKASGAAEVYSLTEADILLNSSSDHNLYVNVIFEDSDRRTFYSHYWDFDNIPPKQLDRSSLSNFSYVVTDTICDFNDTSTLVLSGSYNGYVYGGLNRNTDSLFINLDLKEVVIGNKFY